MSREIKPAATCNKQAATSMSALLTRPATVPYPTGVGSIPRQFAGWEMPPISNILLSPKSPHLSNCPALPCSSMELPLFQWMTCRHAVAGSKTLVFLSMLVGGSSTGFDRETCQIFVWHEHFGPTASRAAHAIRPQSGARPVQPGESANGSKRGRGMWRNVRDATVKQSMLRLWIVTIRPDNFKFVNNRWCIFGSVFDLGLDSRLYNSAMPLSCELRNVRHANLPTWGTYLHPSASWQQIRGETRENPWVCRALNFGTPMVLVKFELLRGCPMKLLSFSHHPGRDPKRFRAIIPQPFVADAVSTATCSLQGRGGDGMRWICIKYILYIIYCVYIYIYTLMISYYIVLYYIILCYILSYYNILYYITSYHIILYYIYIIFKILYTNTFVNLPNWM